MATALFELLRWPALLACGLLSCSPTPQDCGKARPAFHVVLTAADGPLPADTTLRVTYGGVTEKYDLASPPALPENVYCSPRYADGGSGDAGAQDAQALVCDLWTQAAATIEVQGSGYPTLTEDLKPKTDCGVVTVDYQLVLDKGDGGG